MPTAGYDALRRPVLVLIVPLCMVPGLALACSSGTGPAGSPTRTIEQTPSRSVTPTPTRPAGDNSAAANPAPVPPTTRVTVATTSTRIVVSARAASSAPPDTTPAGAAPANAQAAASTSADDNTPAWVWLLVAVGAVLVAAGTALLLHGRARTRRWQGDLDTATARMAALPRDVIPRLAQAPTAQQVAGGWRMERDQVLAIEDELTRLEATAPDDGRRNRAGQLRRVLRDARTRLDGLDQADDPARAGALLRSVGNELEAVVAPPVSAPGATMPA